jgi:hypothetical protein
MKKKKLPETENSQSPVKNPVETLEVLKHNLEMIKMAFAIGVEALENSNFNTDQGAVFVHDIIDQIEICARKKDLTENEVREVYAICAGALLGGINPSVLRLAYSLLMGSVDVVYTDEEPKNLSKNKKIYIPPIKDNGLIN